MIFEELRDVICNEFELDEDCISLETDFLTDLGVDSIDLVDLSMTVEDVFEVEMPFDEDELDKIKTVKDLVKYIEANK